MTEQDAVPLIVLSASRDPVEAINGILRRAGHPVHCTWIPSLRDLGDALTQINPELLLYIDTGTDDLVSTVKVRDAVAPSVPLIVVSESVDELRMAEVMGHGARDMVSMSNPARLQAVMGRELRAFRLERALENTLKSARDARRQLEAVLEHSNDAIVQVQEGIVVDANPAWLKLFGFPDRESLVGQPIMDVFDESTHSALKGALAACLQGRWSDHTLKVTGYFGDGTSGTIDLLLTLGEHDGEPCVRLVVPSRLRDESKLTEELKEAVRRDASTGLLHRVPLLEAVTARIATPMAGGMRYFAMIRLDKFATIERDVGITASEDYLIEFGRLLKEQLGPNDIAGRFGGMNFLVLLERGNVRDVEAWAEQLVAKVSKHIVKIGEQSLTVTCTVGLSAVPANDKSPDAAIAAAMEACRKGRERGGNQVSSSERAEADTRVQSYDSVWVKQIKSALMENRFRLVQQPVASLQGDEANMFDVMIRMVDSNGKEVLPSEFMAAAERNDLLKNIDRWVVGASLSFAAQRKPACLFVRLSKETIKDASFLGWLDHNIRTSRADPQSICFQTPEEVAASHITQIQQFVGALRQRGFKFALERFGSGRDPHGLLGVIPVDFVKIDGALIQGLTNDEELQERVRKLVEDATKRKIATIAERVEDANTMAVLWQIGVGFIQGYFVNAPEEVVLRAER